MTPFSLTFEFAVVILFCTFALDGLKSPILANLFKFLFFNLILIVVPVSYSYLLEAKRNSSL